MGRRNNREKKGQAKESHLGPPVLCSLRRKSYFWIRVFRRFICGLQVTPPSLVTRMVSLLPAAHPWLASTKFTECRCAPVLDCSCTQLSPLSFVIKITPPPPTTQPRSGSAKYT